MSKVRIPINPMQVGRVGAYSMYVRRGEQVVRQRKNSSNYGAEASRSLAQQTRRVRWSNLVNFYKVNAFWMAKAYEGLKAGQTIYNKFMQLNMDKSAVALDKQAAFAGATVCDAFSISDGKLPPITLGITSQEGITPTSISVGDIASPAGVTIGELSAAIIANNSDFQEGDNIALVMFTQTYWAGDVPRVQPRYSEFTLNSSSDDDLNTLDMFVYELATISGKKLAMNSSADAGDYAGFVFIHTRKSAGLQVSPQKIKMVETTVLDQFSTATALQAAIDSYGVDASVPLDPNFNYARVLSAYVNGQAVTSALPSFPSYTGAVTLEISVDGWNDDTCYLMFGDVRYTPLAVNGNVRTYIIGDNGSVRIYINGGLYGGFDVSGIVVPEGLPTLFIARQVVNAGSLDPYINFRFNSLLSCLQWNRTFNEDYPYWLIIMGGSDHPFTDTENFEYFNCTNTFDTRSENQVMGSFLVTDNTKPAYITYKGFIVAVFNYSN